MNGVMKFGKKGKLSPCYIRLYEILERIGDLAYCLALPPNLSSVHDMFHMSMLRKYMHAPSDGLEFEPLKVKEDLTYEQKPMKILDQRDQMLRTKTIPLVKVLWRNHNNVGT